MKIGLTALTLGPACVLGVFFVKKENRFRVIVDCRKANALVVLPPLLEVLSGDGLSCIEVDTSGLVHGESPWHALRVCQCCPLLPQDASLSGIWPRF